MDHILILIYILEKSKNHNRDSRSISRIVPIFPLQIEDPSLGPLVVIKFQLKLKNPHVLKWFYLGNFKRKVFQCNLDVQAFQTPRCPQLE